MVCPKCRKNMHKERDGFLCFCGMWVESPDEPVMKLTKEQWAPKPVPKNVGVPKGTMRSDAMDLVPKFYDSIFSLLSEGASWRSVTLLVKQAVPSARFDVKSLKKYYLLELDKRGGIAV